MKICYLSTFYPFRGGIAQFNAALYRSFEEEHEIKAVTFKRQYPDFLFPGESQYVKDTDKPEIINSEEWLDSINPINWHHTAQKIKKWQPDLLLMKFWMPFFGPSLGHIARQMPKNCKTIAILDNVIPHEKRFFDIPFLRYFLKRINGFVVMSDVVRDDLLKLKPGAKYIQQEHPLYDHFNAPEAPETARQKLELDPNKKTLLFFGFIRGYKGLDLLIQAFEQLDESYQLVIAGECYGSYDSYKNQIEKNRNKNRIHEHIRYIDDNEVSLFFSAADVCILPYKSATQSGITSIAYHFDLPMMATDVGGLKELVEHKITGRIIPSPEPNKIETSIKTYFQEEEQVSYRKNIQQKKKQMTWSSLEKKILNLYNSL